MDDSTETFDPGQSALLDPDVISKPATGLPRSDVGGEHELSTSFRSVTDKVLQFLSTASNETLGACILGLGASTYLILGRVGLVLIGAVGGVALHASWEGYNKGDGGEDEKLRRREVGLDVAQRVLHWQRRRLEADDKLKTRHGDSETDGQADFSGFSPETAKALNTFTDTVIKDYVRWWYSPILPSDEKFPAVSRATFSGFLLSFSTHISRKDPSGSFLEFATNSSSIIIVFLNELSSALNASPTSDPEEAIGTYLRLKPESNLASITNAEQQAQKLLAVADDILESFLDSKVYICPPVRVFLREVLAHLILGMTLSRCSQDEWINEWIVYLLEDGEPELMNAIDAGVEGSAVQKAADARDEAAEPPIDPSDPTEAAAQHKRSQSRAQQAMEEAMREAEMINRMIAEEEARKSMEPTPTPVPADDASDSTNTHGIQTPASSQDDASTTHAEISHETETTVSNAFTSFDQLIPQNIPTALAETGESALTQRQDTLTLFNAQISIFDNGIPGDRRALRSRPTEEYIIQIEPSSSSFPGWMIPRTYTNFEQLHEVLRRISAVSGATAFTDAHSLLPAWKGRTSSQLSQELERYLMDATHIESLAESEGMKRFLEKERGVTNPSPRGKGGFWAGPAAIESMGKGVFDVLSKAPKGVAGGGKAVIGGVTSVFGGAVAMTSKTTTSNATAATQQRSSTDSRRSTTFNQANQNNSLIENGPRKSNEMTHGAIQNTASTTSARPSRSSSVLSTSQSSLTVDSTAGHPAPSRIIESDTFEETQSPQMNLPPPPSDMPDDYGVSNTTSDSATMTEKQARQDAPAVEPPPLNTSDLPPARSPFSTKDTTMMIELLFAIINELYTLSSAWSLRRTLLNAAKTYLLRPGNVQLDNIRELIQDSIIDANTSDSGIAAHIYKMRENALPTEEELKTWPKPRTAEEKERLRDKARRLLVERGMPQALTSVMGAAASGEALGRVFDALQIEKVARGLMFGLMLQALRTAVQ